MKRGQVGVMKFSVSDDVSVSDTLVGRLRQCVNAGKLVFLHRRLETLVGRDKNNHGIHCYVKSTMVCVRSGLRNRPSL